MALTREAVANHVTISTVGLGQDVNRAFLEKVAASAEGKSYFLNDPSGLEQLLLRDVEEHTGIYEAIAAGDPELAAARMRDHILAIDQHYHDVGSA